MSKVVRALLGCKCLDELADQLHQRCHGASGTLGQRGLVKGRSVRSGGSVLTTLSCSASGIFAICCDLTQPTITRFARTFRSTRTRRRREQDMPLVAFCPSHFLADFIICMCVFDFRQAQGGSAYPRTELSHQRTRLSRPGATVCFSRLELTLHGSPALCLAADVVVLPLRARHRHKRHGGSYLQHYP